MQPPVVPGSTRVGPAWTDAPARPGRVRGTRSGTRRWSSTAGSTVLGMAPPSSGGSTVGEALNILENSDLGPSTGPRRCTATSRRPRWRSPTATDTSATATSWTSHSRSCSRRSSPTSAPARSGRPRLEAGATGRTGRIVRAVCARLGRRRRRRRRDVDDPPHHLGPVGQRGRVHPDHRADRWLRDRRAGPRVPAEQRADRLQLHPDAGTAPDPNLPAPGKRPRSSMSPTIVLDDGEPVLAVGSPGGSMIITTVLQTLLNRLDFGYSLPDALAAPRASQRNTASVSAEPAFIAAWAPALAGAGAHVYQRGRDRSCHRDRAKAGWAARRRGRAGSPWGRGRRGRAAPRVITRRRRRANRR